jgi:hypothetical protein
MTTRQQPTNATRWSTRIMAASVGNSEVRHIWRAHGLKPQAVSLQLGGVHPGKV